MVFRTSARCYRPRAFYMDLRNYIGYGSETKTYITYSSQFPNGAQVPYNLTVPINATGRVDGIEFAYQQAFTENFGFIGNYTYADGKQTSCDSTGRRRSAGGHLEEHLQRQRLLREQDVQCAGGLYLSIGVLQRPGSQHGVHAG